MRSGTFRKTESPKALLNNMLSVKQHGGKKNFLASIVLYLYLLGKVTVKVDPSPGVLFTVIVPLHSSTILFTSGSPSPFPSDLREGSP